MKTNQLIILLVVAAVIALFGVFYFSKDAPTEEHALENEEHMEEQTTVPEVGDEVIVAQDHSSSDNSTAPVSVANDNPSPDSSMYQIVTYTEGGFEPGNLTIKKGETVFFWNRSAGYMWVATAQHPTHTVYPGSDIKDCSSAPAGTMFDTCGNIGSGNGWTFTFNEVGSWNYHDHIKPNRWGTILVTE